MKTSEYQAAVARAVSKKRTSPVAASASFDRGSGRVVVNLNSGVQLTFDPADVQGLGDATAAELESIEITPSGLGLYFPKLDVDVYVPALLKGVLGSRKWMAAWLGAAGGKSKSVAKRRAARQNGRLGGRPRKIVRAG